MVNDIPSIEEIDDMGTWRLNEAPVSFGQQLSASVGSVFDTNYATQLYHTTKLYNLRSEIPGKNDAWTLGGLSPDDPGGRVMSVEEANEKGKDLGLRFSEPQTEAQFQYMSDLKQAEMEREHILSRAPSFSQSPLRNTAIFIADLSATAVDPFNIASAFVPVVGSARYARMVTRFGRPVARTVRGAAEGAAGAAMLEPFVLERAHALQQNYTYEDSFNNVVFGGILGGGLHVTAGAIKDKIRAEHFRGVFKEVKKYNEEQKIVEKAISDVEIVSGYKSTFDFRKLKAPEGETPSIMEAIGRDGRRAVLQAAANALENDKFPKVDELIQNFPEARELALTVDSKFPATTRLRSYLGHEDFSSSTSKASDLVEDYLSRTISGADNPNPAERFKSVYNSFVKKYKKLDEWNLETLSDVDYNSRFGQGEQRAFADSVTHKIFVSENAKLGAVRHEIEAALDISHGYTGENSGGYRFRRGDVDGPAIHRQVVQALYEENPSRVSDARVRKPVDAVDAFSKSDSLFGADGKKAADESWDRIQEGKDKNLDTIIDEEEIGAIEDSLDLINRSAREAGILSRIFAPDEQELLKALKPDDLRKRLEELERREGESIDVAAKELAELSDEDMRAIVHGNLDLADAVQRGDIVNSAKSLNIDDRNVIEENAVAKEQELLESRSALAKVVLQEDKEEFNEAKRKRASRKSAAANGLGGRGRRRKQGSSLEAEFSKTRVGGIGETGGIRGAVRDERMASDGEQGSAITARSIGEWGEETSVITPDGEKEVRVSALIVEWSKLKQASGDMQPRDRGTAENRQVALKRARSLDPEQLMPTRVSDSGPPLIRRLSAEEIENERLNGSGYEYEIVSGNGRVETLGHVYHNPNVPREMALRYRERLGVAANSYEQPVLASVIQDNLSHEEFVSLAEKSNRSRVASMTAIERARRDTQAAGVDLMMLYQGGEITSPKNREFVTAFMRDVVTDLERNEMSRDGNITQLGVNRMNAAIMAAAYNDNGMLARMLESTDNNIRSIVSAYRDVASSLIDLRQDIVLGDVAHEMDPMPFMIEAAQFVSRARDTGTSIRNALAQMDALNPLSPTAEAMVRSFYGKDLARAASSQKISEKFLKFINDIRENHRVNQLIDDEATQLDVFEVANRSGDLEKDGTGAFDFGADTPEPVKEVKTFKEANVGGKTVSNEELKSLATSALKKIAEIEGVSIRSNMRKGEIILAITENRRMARVGGNTSTVSESTFIKNVNRAAINSETRPFMDRVSISDVYDAYYKDTQNITLDEFKSKLVELAKRKLIRLGRAELPERLSDYIRNRSETRWGNEEVHFVVYDGPPKKFQASSGWDVAGPSLHYQTELSIRKAMDEAMQRVPQAVRFQILDKIEPFGPEFSMAGMSQAYADRSGNVIKTVISVSRRTLFDPRNTLNHEIIHSVRSLGLITSREWDILSDVASKKWIDPKRRETYQSIYEAQGIGKDGDEMFLEEAIATKFGNWIENRRPPETFVERIFDRLYRFAESIGESLRRAFGMKNYEDVFRAYERGELRDRWKETGGGRADESNANSLHMRSMLEQAKDANAKMVELAKNDYDEIADVTVRAAKALTNCVVHNL